MEIQSYETPMKLSFLCIQTFFMNKLYLYVCMYIFVCMYINTERLSHSCYDDSCWSFPLLLLSFYYTKIVDLWLALSENFPLRISIIGNGNGRFVFIHFACYWALLIVFSIDRVANTADEIVFSLMWPIKADYQNWRNKSFTVFQLCRCVWSGERDRERYGEGMVEGMSGVE